MPFEDIDEKITDAAHLAERNTEQALSTVQEMKDIRQSIEYPEKAAARFKVQGRAKAIIREIFRLGTVEIVLS